VLLIPQFLKSIQTNIVYDSDNNPDYLISAQPESNLLESNFVVSVESIQIQVAYSEKIVSVPLSKNQNISNCIPFVSMKSDYISVHDWDIILSDIYFEPSLREITIERSKIAQNAIDFSVYIVEFDPTKIKIQQGSFNITEDEEISITIIDLVNRSRAFPLSYWYAANGDDGWDHAMVATNISSDNTITFQRGQGTGTIVGHYYVIEALGYEFTVQSAELTLSGASINENINNNVDMSKSIVISSYYTNYNEWDARFGSCDVWLNDNNTIYAQRYGLASTTFVIAFVISFSGYQMVQRGSFSYSNEDIGKQTSITAVDYTHSIIHSPNPYGIMQSYNHFSMACAHYRFINNQTIEGLRGTSEGSPAMGHWEVIEWRLIPDFELFSDAGTPVDIDGNYIMNWTESFKAHNYSLYRDDKFIVEINNNLTLLDDGITNFLYSETNIPHDTIYYYIAIAFSEYGNKTSNCIRVEVSKIPIPFDLTSNADSPDTDGIFTLNWTDSLYVDSYTIFFSQDYITEIDEVVSLFAKEINTLYYSISNLSNGLYYFVVGAFNNFANRSSNVINVVIYSSRDSNTFSNNFILFFIILLISLLSAGLFLTILSTKRKYFSLTKFQREIRNLKNNLLNGNFKKNPDLTREEMIKKTINKIASSVNTNNKKIKDNVRFI